MFLMVQLHIPYDQIDSIPYETVMQYLQIWNEAHKERPKQGKGGTTVPARKDFSWIEKC